MNTNENFKLEKKISMYDKDEQILKAIKWKKMNWSRKNNFNTDFNSDYLKIKYKRMIFWTFHSA